MYLFITAVHYIMAHTKTFYTFLTPFTMAVAKRILLFTRIDICSCHVIIIDCPETSSSIRFRINDLNTKTRRLDDPLAVTQNICPNKNYILNSSGVNEFAGTLLIVSNLHFVVARKKAFFLYFHIPRRYFSPFFPSFWYKLDIFPGSYKEKKRTTIYLFIFFFLTFYCSVIARPVGKFIEVRLENR